MGRRLLPASFVAASLMVCGARARAADPTPEAADLAKARFQSGAEAYAEHRYKDAIDLFLEADRIDPNPAFAYNIGLAYEDLGDADNALRWYRAYLRDLPKAPDRKDIEGRITMAEGRLRDRGVQQVTVLSVPATATISIDGERVGVTPWTGQLKPGRHRVDAELRGYQDASDLLELPSDHAVDFSITLHAVTRAAPSRPLAPPPVESPPESRRERSRGVGWLTWGALGVGVAGLGASLGFEAARSSSVSEARHADTNLQGKDLYDKAKADETLSRVFLGVGGAFAVAGGVLLVLDLSSGPSSSEARAAVGCSGPSCGVTVHGRF